VHFKRPELAARLFHWAFGLYVISYALPAVVIAGDLAFGWQAALLAFAGATTFSERLEPGQFPACVLGVLANLTMLSAYVCCNLRWHSQKRKPSYQLAFTLSAVAVICALGAAGFLVTGKGSFAPHFGYFAWLGSMVLLSYACKTLAKASRREPDAPPEPPPAALVGGGTETMNPRPQSEAPADSGGR